MVHHPAGDFEVYLRIVLVLAAASFAGVELEADPAERLQERVVEVGGKPIALRERGVKLDGCISARPHLSGQQRGLRLDLPPQEPQLTMFDMELFLELTPQHSQTELHPLLLRALIQEHFTT
jgi:hypothetical protein